MDELSRPPTDRAPPDKTFDEFFRREFVPLVAFLHNVARVSVEQASDAAAEAMLKLYLNWVDVSNPRAWIRVVGSRLAAATSQRLTEGKERETRAWLMATDDNTWPSPESTIEELSESFLILKLLRDLPQRQRTVMAWTIDGYTAAEIAAMLNMSQATVRSNIRHARMRLKAAWEQANNSATDE